MKHLQKYSRKPTLNGITLTMINNSPTKMVVCTSSTCINLVEWPDNVAMLPINIHIGDGDYLDGVNISINDISKRIIANPKLPVSTSAPDEGQLIEFFFDLVEKGIDEILLITLSGKLSLTYANASRIQAIFGNKLTIHLFDSRSLSHGETLLVYEASRMLYEGKDFSEIITHIHNIRKRMSIIVTVDNLRAMVKTKRISAPAGFFGDLFDIKPLAEIGDDGRIVPIEKIRGFEESVYRMVELLHKRSVGKKGSFYTACNSVNPHLPLFKRAINEFGLRNVLNVPLASVCVANVGVYAVAMMFVEDYQDPVKYTKGVSYLSH